MTVRELRKELARIRGKDADMEVEMRTISATGDFRWHHRISCVGRDGNIAYVEANVNLGDFKRKDYNSVKAKRRFTPKTSLCYNCKHIMECGIDGRIIGKCPRHEEENHDS